jgi:DNA-binding MurR/RpiR family transcriptional regulator
MFRERITRHYQSLSPSFTKVADFILTSHQQVAFMSASRLAKRLGVDVATVTRFAQQIGYDGYTELIREIQEVVLAEMHEVRAPVMDRIEAAEGRLTRTLWHDWANLEKTIQNLSVADMKKAIDALQSARRVYIVSEGVGAGLGQAMASYLSISKPEAVALSEGPFDLALSLKELGPGDLVLGIGFTKYAFAATRALQLAHKVGAPTIGVISQPDCPIGVEADLLFSCSATEEGYLPSPTGVAAILFVLAYGLLLNDPQKYNKDLVRFQDTYALLTEGTPRERDDVVGDLIERF